MPLLIMQLLNASTYNLATLVLNIIFSYNTKIASSIHYGGVYMKVIYIDA